MNHIEEQLPDYLSGTLDAASASMVERHLDTCAHCRKEAETLRALFHQLDSARELTVPHQYFSTLIPSIRERIERPAFFRPVWYAPIFQRLASVVAAIVVIVFLIRLDPPGTTTENHDNGLLTALQDVSANSLTEVAMDQFTSQPLHGMEVNQETLSEIGSKALSIDLSEEQVPSLSGLLSSTLNNGTSIHFENLSESELNTILERLGERITL